ncbi:MAG TPA: hypothetical protein VLC10_03950 [Patescibacteria group bacterium]|nr:hypothetical protein [Patescibacteria group bacterium]
MRYSLNGDREWVHAVIETFFPSMRAAQNAAQATEVQREPHKPEDREREA